MKEDDSWIGWFSIDMNVHFTSPSIPLSIYRTLHHPAERCLSDLTNDSSQTASGSIASSPSNMKALPKLRIIVPMPAPKYAGRVEEKANFAFCHRRG